jgi:heme exporter protein D
LINQIMRGETMDMINVWISTGATLLATVLLTLAAVRLYQREQVLFGKK